jgi:hypothetical protein
MNDKCRSRVISGQTKDGHNPILSVVIPMADKRGRDRIGR